MHRDKKIGFALGILLIGIVAAFFFRNEPDPFAELPPLDDPAALDSEIAEKPIAPYTEGLDQPAGNNAATGNAWDVPSMYRTDAPPSIPGGNPPITPGAPQPIQLAEPTPVPTATHSGDVPVGNPFGAGTPPRETRPEPPLPENSAWSAVEPTKPQPGNGVAEVLPSPGNSTPASEASLYRIRKGDTLSVLAEKHLGSSRRYMDIYNANRDKLRSPDDIQEGMSIRIPRRVTFSNDTRTPTTDTTVLPPPGQTPNEGEEGKLFSPFSRSPFTPTPR